MCLEGNVTLGGNPGAEMEQLIARLCPAPGIRDLHWHLTFHGDPAALGTMPCSV